MEGHFEHYYENGQLACKGFNKFVPPDYKSTNMEYYSPDGKLISKEEFRLKYSKLVYRWIDELWKEKHGYYPKN